MRNYQEELKKSKRDAFAWVESIEIEKDETAFDAILRGWKEVKKYQLALLEEQGAPEQLTGNAKRFIDALDRRHEGTLKFAGMSNMKKIKVQSLRSTESSVAPYETRLIVNEEYEFSFGFGYPAPRPVYFKKL